MRIFILLTLISLCTQPVFAQKTPEPVLNSFAKKYPDSEAMEWEYFEGKHTASFFQNDDYIVSIFDVAGNWLQSTTQISEEQLPKKVKKCWKKKYKDVQFVTAILKVLERDKKPMYHISFESAENLVNLVYNHRGRIKSKFEEPILMD